MALNKVTVPIPFAAGLDTKIDDKQQEIGSLAALENVIFETPLKIRKRNGYVILPNITLDSQILSDIETITAFEDELCCYTGKNFYSFSEGNQKWVNKGVSEDLFPRSWSVVKNSYTQGNIDSVHIDGIAVFSWQDSRGGVRCTVVDTETDNFLLSDFEISATGTNPHITNIFNFTYILYIDGDSIKYRKLNTTNPTTVEPEQTTVSDVNKLYNKFDVISVGNKIFVAYANNDNAGDLAIFFINQNETTSSIVSEPGQTASNAISMFTDEASRIGVSFASDSELKSVIYSFTLGVKILDVTTIEEVDQVANIAVGKQDDLYYHFYEINTENTSDNFTRLNSVDLAATVGTAQSYKNSVGIASKTFLYENELYIVLIHESPLQSTYFVTDLDGNIICKVAPNNGGTLVDSNVLSKVNQVSDTVFQVATQVKGRLVGTENTDFTSSLGINRTYLEFDIQNKNQNVTAALNHHTSGGVLRLYDGDVVSENGFHLFPEGLKELNISEGGGILTTSDLGNSFTDITNANGLDVNLINEVYTDSANNVFAVSDSALNISTDAGVTFSAKTTDDGLGSLDIREVASNGAGAVAVATADGLAISTDSGNTFQNLRQGAGKRTFYTRYVLSRAGRFVESRLRRRGIQPALSVRIPFSRSSFRIRLFSRQQRNEEIKRLLRDNREGLQATDFSLVKMAPNGTIHVKTPVGINRSDDFGATFDLIQTPEGLGSNTINDIFVEDNSNIYAATTGGLGVSNNGGVTYANRTTADGLGNNNVVSVFADGANVYAATTAGVSVSTNSGLTFTNYDTSNGLDSNFCTQILADSIGTIYVVTDISLNVSNDGGVTWTPQSSVDGLLADDLYDVAIDPSDNVIATSQFGLQVSEDNGATWTDKSQNGGIGNQQVTDLAIDTLGKVYVAAGAGSLSQGTYNYSAVYKWTDNKGQEHLSAPSIPLAVEVTNAADQSAVEIQIPTLRLTSKQNVTIDVYRTEANGTTFYKETSVDAPLANETDVDFVTFLSNEKDTNLINNELLYTTGGVLDNIAAPASRIIETFNNRVFLAGLENQDQLQFSKIITEGVPVEFNDTLTKLVPTPGGPITALKAMDDKLIIFKETAVYYLSGDGPNNLGQQDTFINIELLSSEIGCENPDSLVLTPLGVMFKSRKGIYLLSRSLGLEYIGAPVEKFNALTVSSAEVIIDKNQVRFVTRDGECLVYDYFVNKWATFTNHTGISAVVLNRDYYYVRPDNIIYKEEVSSFTDAGSPIKLRVETDWMNFAGVQGFQRVYKALVLGKFYSKHQVRVRVAYNFIDSFIQEKVIDTADFTDATTYGEDSPYGEPETKPYGGNGNLYQYRVDFKKQKSQSIKISIEDVQNEVLGEGMDLSNIRLEVGVKVGLNKPDQNRVNGTRG